MPIPQKIIKFLDASKVKYEPIEHRTVFTAFDKAQTLKVPEKIIGKTLTIKLDKDYGLVLVPANKNLDKKKLLQVANKWLNSDERIRRRPASQGRGSQVKLNQNLEKERVKRGQGLRYSHADFVTESWMKKNLKGVKLGSIPPFGALWKLPTFIDKSLLNQSKIVVNAGDWNWSIKINPAVFKKTIPGSTIGSFTKVR